jgi:hypothetical protein
MITESAVMLDDNLCNNITHQLDFELPLSLKHFYGAAKKKEIPWGGDL